MAQTVSVVVDDTDRKQVASIAMDRKRPQKHIQRARIVLLSGEGLAVAEVARQAGVSRPAVWRWQTRYAEAGLAALLRDKTRPPGTAKLTTATVAKILALTCSKPPGQVTHWTGRAMARATGVSLRSVQRIWDAHQLQPHRLRTFKRSSDPDFAEKVEDVKQHRNLALTQCWCNWERSWGENVRSMVFMARGISLAPAGLVVERLETTADKITVLARPTSETAACPSCTQVSKSIHSRYERSLSDLPSDGRAVQIKIRVPRFRCHQADCPRRVFAERLGPEVSTAFARRTERLEGIVHHLGPALGGRPGQGFARRLIIPVSKDTLLRVVRRRTPEPTNAPRVVGIDNWAWKRGHRYGTIICDLERRRIIDILPDREAATVTKWLAEHPSITIIARDRGAGFVQAATQGRPEAVQVADRCHLMENASAAFLGAIKQSTQKIRKAFGTGVVDPALLTSAETRQYDGWIRREDEDAAVLASAKAGVPIKEKKSDAPANPVASSSRSFGAGGPTCSPAA